jgi:Cof subfamily protein (haloacid dehalogenase superfamily)
MLLSRIKLVAVDCDDTLLDKDLSISQENYRAITEAAARGVMVTLATGRMFQSCLPYAEHLDLKGPLIVYNGALVKDRRGNVWSCQTIPKDIALEIAHLAMLHRLCLNVYVQDRLYVSSLNEMVDYYVSVANVTPHVVGDLAAFIQDSDEPTKLLFVDEEERIAALAVLIRQGFSEVLEITSSKSRFLELMSKGVSKGEALLRVSKALGFSKDEIMAIGDSHNDLSMLQVAGIGVAVGNAVSELKEIADYVSLPHDYAGVAHAIDKFVLESPGNPPNSSRESVL